VPDQSFVYALLKMTIVLLVIISLIFALYYFLKKQKLGFLTGLQNEGTIQVRGRQYLGPKMYLVHVEWENSVFLLAVTADKIKVLKEIEMDMTNKDKL